MYLWLTKGEQTDCSHLKRLRAWLWEAVGQQRAQRPFGPVGLRRGRLHGYWSLWGVQHGNRRAVEACDPTAHVDGIRKVTTIYQWNGGLRQSRAVLGAHCRHLLCLTPVILLLLLTKPFKTFPVSPSFTLLPSFPLPIPSSVISLIWTLLVLFFFMGFCFLVL